MKKIEKTEFSEHALFLCIFDRIRTFWERTGNKCGKRL